MNHRILMAGCVTCAAVAVAYALFDVKDMAFSFFNNAVLLGWMSSASYHGRR